MAQRITRPDSTTRGHLLTLDPTDGQWALWLLNDMHDLLVVSWRGDLVEPPTVHRKGWNNAFLHHLLTDDEASQCLMLAAHTSDPRRWYDFAKRVASRKTIDERTEP